MGWMDFMGKMIAGKPVFEEKQPQVGEQPGAADVSQAPQPGSQAGVRDGARLDEGGRKVVAEAEVRRVETHERGSNIELWGHIKNLSSYPIFLDKINLLGQKTELDRILDAGEENEMRIYSGPEPSHDNYPMAELYYRDQASNDYFLAYHQIQYGGGDDGKHYEVHGLRLVRPIKDV